MRKLIAFLMILVILGGGFFLIRSLTHTDIYQDSREFQEFADKAFYEKTLFNINQNVSVDYKYDEAFATAVRKDTDTGELISEFRDKKIKDRIKKCRAIVKKEKSKDLKHACVVDSTVHQSGNGAESLVIYTKLYEEHGSEMVLKKTEVRTFLFSEESGNRIKPLQALNVNYRAKASSFCRNYFNKAFGKEKLNRDWRKYVSEKDSNYNKFLLTGNTVIFFFDEDTVADPSCGTITVKIPYKYILSAVRPKVLERYINKNQPMVAVTYDDGPGGKSEARILECLEKNGAVATFFYQGYRLQYFGDNAVKAAEIGCEIGNHSWDHPQLSLLSKKQIERQIKRTNEEIKDLTGVTPELIRPPYGDFNNKVNSVIKSMGMTSVLWTLDTRDWESRNPKKIFQSVKNSKNLDGKIILMHSIYDETASASEQIIPWLQKHGYQLVTVSELVKYKTGKSPKAGQVIRSIR